jgi:hypothetical protein
VFIVDDNFIGNYHKALALSRELAVWQEQHQRPFSFTPGLQSTWRTGQVIAAMVAANFMYVFIGIKRHRRTAERI